MRTLIYKRVHIGDPDSEAGVFGNHDCMGSVRERQFHAVIGIGGIGQEPRRYGIDGKLNWIGIGPIYDGRSRRGPRLRFRHFKYFGQDVPLLRDAFPTLAGYMYDKNRRSIMHSPSSASGRLNRDVEKALRLAKTAPRSKQSAKHHFQSSGGKCKPIPRDSC
jgi:hypothetical protein